MIVNNIGILPREKTWRYHNIIHDDMRNGDGLRVTIFLSGCTHYCKNCQNPETWDSMSGIPFDIDAWNEVIDQLKKDYIQGVTLSGGDPLNPVNRYATSIFVSEIKNMTFSSNKDIWIYTGYLYEDLIKDHICRDILSHTDVLVDGPFKEELADVKYHWAGSTNQRVIDVQKCIQREFMHVGPPTFINPPVLWEN